jgi:purine-binding chemotaxis protein CheW
MAIVLHNVATFVARDSLDSNAPFRLSESCCMTSHTSAEDAAVRSAAAAGDGSQECLSFQLGAVEYGIDILKVQEIRGYEEPTRMANAPAFIKGVLNLRGDIVPIVDLRIKFGQESFEYGPSTVTVILNMTRMVIGIVVDAVSDVVELAPEQIRPAPDFDSAVGVGFITGIGTVQHGEQQRMLILVDIERLMASADMGLIAQPD